MSAKYGISIHPAQGQFLVAVVYHAEGRQAADRGAAAMTSTSIPFPLLNLKGCRALHVDGHPAGCRDPLRKTVPRRRYPDFARRRRPADQSPRRAARIHRRRHRRRTAVRADGPDAGKDAGVSQEPRLPGRRRHPGREGPALVRRSGGPFAPCRRCRLPENACSIPTAPAMCFTALTCFPISTIPARAGTTISNSRAPPRPTRSSASATRPACPTLADIDIVKDEFKVGIGRREGVLGLGRDDERANPTPPSDRSSNLSPVPA